MTVHRDEFLDRLKAAADECGWTPETQLIVLADFLAAEQKLRVSLLAEFKSFLASLVASELEAEEDDDAED
jgi:hypothetical protein